jgi:hypothetical protein
MMRRLPSPWITVPVLLGTITGGVVGFLVTEVSCNPGSCTAAAAGIGLLAAVAAFFGIGTVMVLAVRSIAEWRALEARGGPMPPADDEEPGPPTC